MHMSHLKRAVARLKRCCAQVARCMPLETITPEPRISRSPAVGLSARHKMYPCELRLVSVERAQRPTISAAVNAVPCATARGSCFVLKNAAREGPYDAGIVAAEMVPTWSRLLKTIVPAYARGERVAKVRVF